MCAACGPLMDRCFENLAILSSILILSVLIFLGVRINYVRNSSTLSPHSDDTSRTRNITSTKQQSLVRKFMFIAHNAHSYHSKQTTVASNSSRFYRVHRANGGVKCESFLRSSPSRRYWRQIRVVFTEFNPSHGKTALAAGKHGPTGYL